MRIERIELYHIKMPLVAPFQTSGWTEVDRAVPLVAVYSQGLVGWGECVASQGPWYSYETDETAWLILSEYLIPMVLGQDITDPSQPFQLTRRVRGHNMAKAALEMAIWDLLGQAQGVSLAQMLGGVRDCVEVGVSVGIQPSIQATLQTIQGYLDMGYRRIKIKIKPGWDVEVVRAIRREFGDIRLQVDANSAYRLDEALPVFKAMDAQGLLLIEQPLGEDDILDHAKLQPHLHTPLCLDESIHTLDHARWALEVGACRVINIKQGRVGGLWVSRQIHDLCQAQGIPVWCGGMLETGIGRAANVALASLPNFRLPGDISASDRYYHEDLIDPPFRLNPDSTLTVPTGPGLGVRPVPERLAKVTLRRAEFCASRG
ncbi:MAG: o-succinylbenzoate synthase [Chloroflexota bacterium]